MLSTVNRKQINQSRYLVSRVDKCLDVPAMATYTDAAFFTHMRFLEAIVTELHDKIMAARKSYLGKKESPEATMALYAIEQAHIKLIDGYSDLNEKLFRQLENSLGLHDINLELEGLNAFACLARQEAYMGILKEKLDEYMIGSKNYVIFVDLRTQTFALRCKHPALRDFSPK